MKNEINLFQSMQILRYLLKIVYKGIYLLTYTINIKLYLFTLYQCLHILSKLATLFFIYQYLIRKIKKIEHELASKQQSLPI